MQYTKSFRKFALAKWLRQEFVSHEICKYMKKLGLIPTVAYIMLPCMASSPLQSLQTRLYGTWRPSGDQVIVFQIDKDSLYYIDEDPIVAISYKFSGDSISFEYWGETIVQHISFRKDTLVMKNKLGEVNCFVPVQ